LDCAGQFTHQAHCAPTIHQSQLLGHHHPTQLPRCLCAAGSTDGFMNNSKWVWRICQHTDNGYDAFVSRCICTTAADAVHGEPCHESDVFKCM
jgi:hypothetical protein